MNAVTIKNLKGILTEPGFAAAEGRHPSWKHCELIPGAVELVVDAGAEQVLDGQDLVACPAWIDSHTHTIFGGSRANEHFLRWKGQSYAEINAAGGGIHSSVRQTAETKDELLLHLLTARLRKMRRGGVGTVEVKSGYGGSAAGELRLLRLIKRAAEMVPEVEVVTTFLGLHARPAGWAEAEFTVEMMAALDVISAEGLADCVDSFPERGFFSLESALAFSRAAIALGIPVTVHADQLSDFGASRAFIELGALSIDHCEHISEAAVGMLAGASTVATLLPGASFFLNLPYANARRLLEAGARVALATDYNPGSAPEAGVQLTIQLAASKLHMTAAEIFCALTYSSGEALPLRKRPSAWTFWRVRGGFRGSASEGWLEQILLDGECVGVEELSRVA